MAKTQYLTFYVNLTDKVRVEQLQTQYPTGYIVAPQTGAAVEFSAPWHGYTAPAPGIAGTWTPWSGAGSADGHYPINVATFTRKSGGWFGISSLFGTTTKYYWVASFVYTEPLAAPDNTGTAAEVADPIERVNIPDRRWVDGSAFPGSGQPGSSGLMYNRAAGRAIDGTGVTIAVDNQFITRTLTDFVPGIATKDSWERFYICPQTYPTLGPLRIWSCRGAINSALVCSVELSTAGEVILNHLDGAGVPNLRGTSAPIPLKTWVRVDVIVHFSTTGYSPPTTDSNGRIRVYLNGALAIETIVNGTSAGLGYVQNHLASYIGTNGGAANGGEVQVADWICADVPTGLTANAWATAQAYVTNNQVTRNGKAYRCVANHTSASANQPPNPTYWIRQESLDWASGSRCVLVKPTGLAASHNAAWLGDWRLLLQNPPESNTTSMTSSTSGARMAVTTDGTLAIDAVAGAIGCVALLVARYGTPGTTNGSIGYSLNAGAPVMTALVETGSTVWRGALYRGPAALVPADVTPLELYYDHGADTGAASMRALMATAEIIGTFGPEDVGPAQGEEPWSAATAYAIGARATSPNETPAAGKFSYPVSWIATAASTNQRPPNAAYWRDATNYTPQPRGKHNAPYPRSPWALATAAPQSPVAIVSGTYVGTGTYKELTFKVPVAWIWIRPLTGNAGGAHWWSSQIGAHWAARQHTHVESVVQALEDPSYSPGAGQDVQQTQYLLRLVGGHAQSNANAVTYQYVAICDPGQRFVSNGAWHHATTATQINALVDPGFTPDCAFFWWESPDTTTTSRFYYKGPGHAVDTVQLLDAAELAAAASFGAGIITTLSAFHNNLAQLAYSAWRKNDGSGDAGASRVVQLYSYTGNGAASRTLPLTPASGRRPLFAIVVPHGAVCYFRDPSHGTSDSHQFAASAASTTAITGGGIDEITVGTTLNTNGTLYDVFVIPGDTVAGNGGWSINGEFFPVEPDSAPPGTGGYPPSPTDPDTIPPPVVVPPTLPGLEDDLGSACVAATTGVINRALARIGISKQIVTVATDASPEAAQARLHYASDVQTVLRDFPWPFARRYATLTLVGGSAGSPLNSDWIYSYRRPTDCVFERRIVVARAGTLHPTPPPFDLGSDTTGGLIYCNIAAAVLEYTARVACPASLGDPLFVEALTWRHAASLAPPLTRLPEKLKEALAMYVLALQQAALVHAPAKPGTQPAASTLDTTAAQLAANVAVINRALVRIGATPIAAVDDQSREALAAGLIFEEELKSVLRDFPWPFATGYAALVVVGGTATVRLNDDWGYSYRLPADHVFTRRIMTATGRAYDETPIVFRDATDATGGLLYTDAATATIEYTARRAGVVLAADALFRDALAWRLAACLAPSVASVRLDERQPTDRGPENELSPRAYQDRLAAQRARIAADAWARYEQAIVIARVRAANEQQPPTGGDAPWITART